VVFGLWNHTVFEVDISISGDHAAYIWSEVSDAVVRSYCYGEKDANMFLQNYMVLQPEKLQSKYSLLWKSKILYNTDMWLL
jgi:hypothetical protein